jgi:dipeptidase
MGQCHHIQHETDAKAAGLKGSELQDLLNDANEKMANLVYSNMVDLLGEMLAYGHKRMLLQYNLHD